MFSKLKSDKHKRSTWVMGGAERPDQRSERFQSKTPAGSERHREVLARHRRNSWHVGRISWKTSWRDQTARRGCMGWWRHRFHSGSGWSRGRTTFGWLDNCKQWAKGWNLVLGCAYRHRCTHHNLGYCICCQEERWKLSSKRATQEWIHGLNLLAATQTSRAGNVVKSVRFSLIY